MPKSNDFSLTIFFFFGFAKEEKGDWGKKSVKKGIQERKGKKNTREREKKCKKKYTVKGKKIGLIKSY